MNDALESARYCLAHAARRIRELESEVAAFGALNPFLEFWQKDPKSGEQVLKVKLTRSMPQSLSGIAVDAVGQLRATLDQAGYAVAVAAGSKGKMGQFPFGGTLADAQLRKKGRSKDIPQEIFDLMIGFRPYRGGNDRLWGLNRLCNTNKHEVIVPLVTASNGFAIRDGVINGPVSVTAKWDGVKGELEVARIGAGGSIKGNFQYSFFVAVGPVEAVGGQPAIELLDALAEEIGRILNAIEAEALRLGVFK